MSVQENHTMLLLLLLDPAVHNSSVKCDRMKSQKVRRRPESCHSYHAQVSILPHHDTSKNTYIHTTLLKRKYYNNKYYKNFSNVKAERFFLLKLMPAKKLDKQNKVETTTVNVLELRRSVAALLKEKLIPIFGWCRVSAALQLGASFVIFFFYSAPNAFIWWQILTVGKLLFVCFYL